MSHLMLLIIVVAWGFSWYGIALQLSTGVEAIVTIAYRFILAAALLIGFLAIRGRLTRIPAKDHIWLAGLGFCLFSMNFFCFYLAANYLPSGLLSVVFATAAIMAVFNQWLILRNGLDRRVLLAAPAGVIGLAMLLWPQIAVGKAILWWAVLLPVLGTYLFSLGNLISARLSRSYDLPSIVAFGMAYGAANSTFIALMTGAHFPIPREPIFWGALVFLAVVSSVIAFLTYLSLVNREGPARAAYATVLFPIVAMAVSAWFEGYSWTIYSTIGLGLALGGTMLVFSGPKGADRS